MISCGASGCNGYIGVDSHQADPCSHCEKVFHDRCFYTRKHGCVVEELIQENKEYAQLNRSNK